MQYFQGPKTKQIFGRSAALVALADFVAVPVAAAADGALASAPMPTVAAATAVSAKSLILFIVCLLLA
jgi:hypothetical protein